MCSVRETERKRRPTGPMAIALWGPRPVADLHAVDLGVARQVDLRGLAAAGKRGSHVLDVLPEFAVHFEVDDIGAQGDGLALVVQAVPGDLVGASVARGL